LVATFFFVISALFAPQRGLLARWRRERQNAARESRQHFLRACFELMEQLEEKRPLRLAEIADRLGWEERRTERMARRLRRAGSIVGRDDGWELSSRGFEEGLFVVKSHRLWEHYLYYRSILTADHVDRPADEVEHLLTPEIIARLEEILVREKGIDAARITDLHVEDNLYRQGGRDA